MSLNYYWFYCCYYCCYETVTADACTTAAITTVRATTTAITTVILLVALTLWHQRVGTLYALSHLIFTIDLLGNFHCYLYLREK